MFVGIILKLKKSPLLKELYKKMTSDGRTLLEFELRKLLKGISTNLLYVTWSPLIFIHINMILHAVFTSRTSLSFNKDKYSIKTSIIRISFHIKILPQPCKILICRLLLVVMWLKFGAKDNRIMLRFLLLIAFSTTLVAQDWSNWRGPNFNGAIEAKNLPVKFSPTENVKWKIKKI